MDAGSRPEDLALDEPARAQIAAVLEALRDGLGPDLVGAYLHGSAVLGGLRPHSDLDVLAVSERQMTRPERASLIARLLAISGPYPAAAPPR
ncbi:MAG: nucleotidyltransferase domain-containing protein, partial [Solirubrobacterales bacterium]